MSDVGYLIWNQAAMPADPKALVAICNQYHVDRVAPKVLDGTYKFNVKNGDKPFMDYYKVVADAGIIVEAWGYHYPTNPGPQGDAIEERREKLKFATYMLNVEAEFSGAYGMAGAAKLLSSKVKTGGFEMLLCSYRFPVQHPQFPINAFMNHENVDGSTPEVYWALAHNPAAQLRETIHEYKAWNKPLYPMGSTFGATFKSTTGEAIYWEPTVEEIVEFREATVASGINRMYYYSLDWVIAHKRWDWLEASTGFNDESPDPSPDPTPEPEVTTFVVSNCDWLNGRSEPVVVNEPNYGNKIVTVRAGQKVKNLKETNGQWMKVGLGDIKVWMHGDYLE